VSESQKNLAAVLGLLRIRGLGATKIKRLIDEFGSAHAIIEADRQTLAQLLGDTIADRILKCTQDPAVRRNLEKIAQLKVKYFIYGEENYPQRLRNIPAPPPVLFYYGELKVQDERAVAVVGTRRPSPDGVFMAEKIARGLAEAGVTVVSGLATGIDSIAHRAALAAGGRTIAVLGNGPDMIYPPQNRKLARQIVRQGAVMTEFPPGTRPERYNFPRRNRIISGLSLGVVMVEGGADSGALITANHALEQGREVFAVPGSPTRKTTAGNNKLLKDGAIPITSAEEILEALKIPSVSVDKISATEQKIKKLSGAAKILFENLSHEPIHIDDLARRCKMDTAFALSALFSLEIEGLVKQLPGKRFVRNV